MYKIVLATINARYIHSSIGLRYLFANLNELQSDSVIQEYDLTQSRFEIAEKILRVKPKIIGFGVYIWNAEETSKVIQTIKKVSTETTIILGGPEASYTPFRVDFSAADYIIQGEGDNTFYNTCKGILEGTLPKEKMIKAELPEVNSLKLPYKFYNDEDIKNRVIYTEASRGCPFSCEFCLSSIDKAVRNFDIEILLEEFEILWQRGVRNFKFVDRTFNLNIKISNKILDFFLSKEPPYFVHFEVIPEHFPEALKEKLKLFPKGALQLEVGIQTLNPETADNIKRKLNFQKIKENISYLENETNAHLHVDLIIGLPGETIESFAENLNTLSSITNSEIQLGVLKKLSGTDINLHDEKFGMVYSDIPPYEILKNDLIPFDEMQKMKHFARYWDLTYNSGNFNKTIRLLWRDENVFTAFYNFSEWLYLQSESTWQISLNRLAEYLFNYLTEVQNYNKTEAANQMVNDIAVTAKRKIPKFLKEFATHLPEVSRKENLSSNKRQVKHIR